MNSRFPILVLALSLVAMFALVALAASGTDGDGTPQPAAPAPGPQTDFQPRYTAEEQALLAIQTESQIRLRAIADRLKAETDPERRRELQNEGVAIKKEARLVFLETLAGFARQRGDLVTEQQALDQINNLKYPRRTTGDPIRQGPNKREIQRGEK
jgi:hypothetical protein